MVLNVDESCSAGTTFDFMDDAYDTRKTTALGDPSESIIDIREYDVPYHVRVSIDKGMLLCFPVSWIV